MTAGTEMPPVAHLVALFPVRHPKRPNWNQYWATHRAPEGVRCVPCPSSRGRGGLRCCEATLPASSALSASGRSQLRIAPIHAVTAETMVASATLSCPRAFQRDFCITAPRRCGRSSLGAVRSVFKVAPEGGHSNGALAFQRSRLVLLRLPKKARQYLSFPSALTTTGEGACAPLCKQWGALLPVRLVPKHFAGGEDLPSS
jgi:hypothetical protein